MKFKEYCGKYSVESECKLKFKQIREQAGITCKRCKGSLHYWKVDKQVWECKTCKFRTTLRSGTVMEGSKLPYRYWLAGMHFLSENVLESSVKSVQVTLEHKRYEPIWNMLNKLNKSLIDKERRFNIVEQIVLNEGFFCDAK